MPAPILVYLACPTRLGVLSDVRQNMLTFVADQGKAPIHPHAALPAGIYEGQINREQTIEVCYRLVELCDELWVCGLSGGVLLEAAYFFNHGLHERKPLQLHLGRFDPDWQQHATMLRHKHSDTLTKLGIDY